jgi:hypothetical protein
MATKLMEKRVSNHTIDREKQEDPIAAQELAVSREKAQRAREQFEREYEIRVQQQRLASGCCEMCGKPLNRLDRIRRASRHRRCRTFVD